MIPGTEDKFLSQIREIVQVEIKRLDALIAVGFAQVHDEMAAERIRVNEQMELRAQHQAAIDAAEAKRIDANTSRRRGRRGYCQ